MTHFILVKDSHPSDVRFRKSLQAISDHLLTDNSSFVTVIFWDRYRSSVQLPLSQRIKYVSILPFLLTSNSYSLFKPIWCFAIFIYVFLLSLCNLFTGVKTILYCADFLAAFSCSFSSIICGHSSIFIYDIYDEVGLLFENKNVGWLFTFLDFFPHLAANRIVKVSHNRIPYSRRLIFRHRFGDQPDLDKRIVIIPNSPSYSSDYNELRNRVFPKVATSNAAFNQIHSTEFECFSGDFFVISGYLSDSRGIASILEFATDFPGHQFCVFGSGLSSCSHEIIDKLPNVTLFQPLDQFDLFRVQIDAIGIFSLYDPKVPINRLAVPNKVWDSVICRVPLIVNSEIMATADPLLKDQSVSIPYQYSFSSWADLNASCIRLKRFLSSFDVQAISIPDSVALYSRLIKSLP